MTRKPIIRLATAADTCAVLAIYAPFIQQTTITFEYAVPTLAEFGQRMSDIQKKYPWLLCEFGGDIAGYAYASKFNERAAYEWSVDFSIYIQEQYQGRKIGKSLYFALFELLKMQGYYNAYAGIAMPNRRSEQLHQGMGFKPIGVYHNVGYKFGHWHDVKWFELKIQNHSEFPIAPRGVEEIYNTIEFRQIIQQAEQQIVNI